MSFNYIDPKGDVTFEYLNMSDDNDEIFPSFEVKSSFIRFVHSGHCVDVPETIQPPL